MLYNMLKKYSGIIIVAIIISIAVVTTKTETVCERTLAYNIGNVDSRFQITHDELVDALKEVEKIWEDPTGYNLFEYDPLASENDSDVLIIDFIFDQRQQITTKMKEVEEIIEDNIKELELLSAEYEEKLDFYNRRVSNYNYRLGEYVNQVDYYNMIGGAPEYIYNQLMAEGYELELEEHELNRQMKGLNRLEDNENKLFEYIKALSEKAYEVVDMRGDFGAGMYTDYDNLKKITVYEFGNREDLILLLAHEFGHALNLDHADDPHAIMHAYIDLQDLNDIRLTQADINLLKAECGIK